MGLAGAFRFLKTVAGGSVAPGEGPSKVVLLVADVPAVSSPHSGNVIAPAPGACFRYVPDEDRGGYPVRCGRPVRWRGAVVDPAGRRIAVESCDGHAGVLVDRRAAGDGRLHRMQDRAARGPRPPAGAPEVTGPTPADPSGEAIEGEVRAVLDRLGREYEVLACDPAFADTAAFCERYGVDPEDSANTIVVVGKGAERSYAACVVLATTRLDVNGVVRQRLGVRKASFASAEETVERTGMMIGGVTVLALPDDMAVWVDGRVMTRRSIVLGGGSRSMKIRMAPDVLLDLPAVEVVDGLAR